MIGAGTLHFVDATINDSSYLFVSYWIGSEHRTCEVWQVISLRLHEVRRHGVALWRRVRGKRFLMAFRPCRSYTKVTRRAGCKRGICVL